MKQEFYMTSTEGYVLDFLLIQHKQKNNSINQFKRVLQQKIKTVSLECRMINGALNTMLSMTLGKKSRQYEEK